MDVVNLIVYHGVEVPGVVDKAKARGLCPKGMEQVTGHLGILDLLQVCVEEQGADGSSGALPHCEGDVRDVGHAF